MKRCCALVAAIWITPFGGYRFNDALNLSDTNYSKIEVTDNPVYGLAIALPVTEGAVELMWTHNDSGARAVPVPGSGAAAHDFDLNTDQFHFNGLYFPPEFEGTAHPFVLGGVGMTRFTPGSNYAPVNKFSFALGGGAIFDLTTRLGIRLEGKWNPAVISSSGSVFCNSSTGQCFVTSSGDLFDQFDFTAGLTFRL